MYDIAGADTIYVWNENGHKGYVETFYTDNILIVDKPKIYKGGFYSTPADAVEGKYFEVEKYGRSLPASHSGMYCC